MFPRLHFSLERWKKNKKYDVYVSNYGNIRSCKNHEPLEQRLDGKGYSIVFTKNGTVPVHRLVGETWLQKTKEDGTTIDHIDNNKRNNSVKNLRWLSAELNCEYSSYKTYLTVENKQETKKTEESSTKKIKESPIKGTELANILLNTFKISNDYAECGTILQKLLDNKIVFLDTDGILSIRQTNDLYRKGMMKGISTPNKKVLFQNLAKAIKKHSSYMDRVWALKNTTTGDLIQDV